MLEVKNINKVFDGFSAIKNISFSLQAGEIHAIIGPNGSGKTTLFNLISGLIALDAGTVHFEGLDLAKIKPHQIVGLGMSRSFQSANIFPKKTVFENMQIALIAKNQAHLNFFKKSDGIYFTQAMELLQAVKLDNEANALSGRLAHGMQKQLELAIALASDPKLLLLDEPTAGMSLAETQLSIQLITNIVKDRSLTLLFTEHDMNVVFAIADHISVLHHGEVIVSGPPELIRQNQTVRRIYLGHDKV